MIPNITICPLPFWPLYESAGDLMASLLEQDITFQKWLGRSKLLRALARGFFLPTYYHLITSGYGAFAGDELAGWLYLRGWRQILYIEALATRPDWRRRGIGSTLMHFAEEQARTLHREWLGLTATATNEAAICLYEQLGYRRAHWRIAHHDGEKCIPGGEHRRIRLQSIFGLTAWQAYRRFTAIDLAAGDGWAAPASTRLLEFDPHRRVGKQWLVTIDDQPVAYLNKHGSHACTYVYVACGPEWWEDGRIVDAIGTVLNDDISTPGPISLRLASNGHHDAALPLLMETGFMTRPANMFKMFKYLGSEVRG